MIIRCGICLWILCFLRLIDGRNSKFLIVAIICALLFATNSSEAGPSVVAVVRAPTLLKNEVVGTSTAVSVERNISAGQYCKVLLERPDGVVKVTCGSMSGFVRRDSLVIPPVRFGLLIPQKTTLDGRSIEGSLMTIKNTFALVMDIRPEKGHQFDVVVPSLAVTTTSSVSSDMGIGYTRASVKNLNNIDIVAYYFEDEISAIIRDLKNLIGEECSKIASFTSNFAKELSLNSVTTSTVPDRFKSVPAKARSILRLSSEQLEALPEGDCHIIKQRLEKLENALIRGLKYPITGGLVVVSVDDLI